MEQTDPLLKLYMRVWMFCASDVAINIGQMSAFDNMDKLFWACKGRRRCKKNDLKHFFFSPTA